MTASIIAVFGRFPARAALALAVAAAVALPGALRAESAVEEAGRMFAESVTATRGDSAVTLVATGKATRKKFVVKVYAMVHYLDTGRFPSREAAIEAIRNGTHVRRIVMEFVRGVGADKIRNAYREGFEKAVDPAHAEELAPLVDRFIEWHAHDVADGDRYVYTAWPDGRVDVEVQGESKPPIVNAAFAKALWDIWFGEHSPVDPRDLVKFTSERNEAE